MVTTVINITSGIGSIQVLLGVPPFLSWVANQVGLSGYKSAAVSGIYAVLPKVTTRSLDGVKRGDFVCYNWDNRSATDWMDHIGVVEWVNPGNGEFGTIEGNTTDTLSGLVARRTRTVKSNYFTAFCRPGYTVSFLSTIADAVRKAAEIAKEGVQPQKFTGEYTIQNVGSGKMLNVFATPSSVKQGSEVRACNKDGSPEQRFRMDSSGSDKYHITSLINNAGYCIDTYGTPSTLVSGAKVHVWTPSVSEDDMMRGDSALEGRSQFDRPQAGMPQTDRPWGGSPQIDETSEKSSRASILDLSSCDKTLSFAQRESCPFLVRNKTNEKIIINKPEFIIGRIKGFVDYFMAENAAISRIHAVIISRDKKYYIVDTESINATCVNGTRIPVKTDVEIFHGDIIKLANEELGIGVSNMLRLYSIMVFRQVS